MSDKRKFNETLKRHFFKLPNNTFDLNLSSTTFMVFAYVVSCGNNYHPSQRYIAKILNMSPNTIKKAVKALLKIGLLEKKRKSRRGCKDTYFITPHNEWLASPQSAPVFDKELSQPLPHIQKDQEDNRKNHISETVATPQLASFIQIALSLAGSKKAYAIPGALSDWLENNQPDFSFEELNSILPNLFTGQQGATILQNIRGELKLRWDLAEIERVKHQKALKEFADKQLEEKLTTKKGECHEKE